MASSLKALLTLVVVVVLLQPWSCVYARRPRFVGGPWKNAHATFYGAGDGTGRTGACGYSGTNQDLKFQTTALSNALFINGQGCGSCYELKCDGDVSSCKVGQPSIFVTATDQCPPGGWCNPPLEHFDLAELAFLQIAEYKAGIVPVQYRRVPCQRQGGVRFTIEGNPNFNLVTVWNVGGAGDITNVQVKGDNEVSWIPLRRNWGQKWETDATLVGKALSFRVTTSDGRSSVSRHVTPQNWQFGQSYEGKNFR
ncbi:hypothetical protein RHMOL_Rhmol03G0098600 [Rhododendron molle]|uniref:Uncharacterized protein n=1 Tax=Rhododendron molle TaxID=49168 RepID=A0ACC0PDP5_RHOML|nr:hypothetical protein RHMOL_Rhmol03G0098600 [Rhododendron molle]